jgi:hypothetical protein
MIKYLYIILKIAIYIIIFYVQCFGFILINYLATGQLTGIFTALGAIVSIWTSFKFVIWLGRKYFNSSNP